MALRLAGAALTIAAVAWLAAASGRPLLITSYGGSSVLVFLFQDRPFSQPAAVIGGHVLSAGVGLALMAVLGSTPLAMGLGVAGSMAAMVATRTLHPPAAANPLIVMSSPVGWGFLLAPVLAGSVIVTAGALLTHRLRRPGSYPLTWRPASPG
jgi:CBS-domain-containing membrane protein